MSNENRKKYESQRRWQEKNGFIPKTYKLDKRLVEEFKEACDKLGISQASKLSELMCLFVKEIKK